VFYALFTQGCNPCGTGNATISDGSLPKTIESILADLKPEAAYLPETMAREPGSSSST